MSLDPHNGLSCKCRTQKIRGVRVSGFRVRCCAPRRHADPEHVVDLRRVINVRDKEGEDCKVCADKCRPIFIVGKHLFFFLLINCLTLFQFVKYSAVCEISLLLC